ncbi:MAG: amino acid carrier protein [Legionellales bacterium]|nr:amino acid carrier protein [Legionellales bacterium]
MGEVFFSCLDNLNEMVWGYVCVPVIVILGIYFTIKFKFAQITKSKLIFETFLKFIVFKKDNNIRGISPLRAFFASVGGCIGIGNVIAVCTAVQIGGPGSIFWMWVAAFFGMLLKYSEVYLGVKFRVANTSGGFDGGPMFYLQRIFKSRLIPNLFAFFLVIYGVEVYMFNIMTNTISLNWDLNKYFVIFVTLGIIIYTSIGGMERIGSICSTLIPLFVVIYSLMSIVVIIMNADKLLSTLHLIFVSAFNGHAAIGGFLGSSVLLSMSQGVARAAYSSDIGIGFASIIHAESCEIEPAKQARLAIFGIFLDTFLICTLSTLLLVVTDIWHENIPASMVIQTVLGSYFPFMDIFMPFFIYLLGYTSLISFFFVGLKCARFLLPNRGQAVYYCFAIVAFVVFSFIEPNHVLLFMAISGACLLLINVFGIFKLRKEISLE